MMYFMMHRLEKVKPATLRQNYFAIKSCATMYGQSFQPNDMPTLEIMRKSIDKVFGGNQPDKRLPFTFKMLADAIKYFDFMKYNDVVYYTMMTCGITALLRTGEFCANNKAVNANINNDDSVRALFIYETCTHIRTHKVM